MFVQGAWDRFISISEIGLPPCWTKTACQIDTVILGAPGIRRLPEAAVRVFPSVYRGSARPCWLPAGDALNAERVIVAALESLKLGEGGADRWISIDAAPRASQPLDPHGRYLRSALCRGKSGPAARSESPQVSTATSTKDPPPSPKSRPALSGTNGWLGGGSPGGESLSFPAAARITPDDGLNLARAFPGDPAGQRHAENSPPGCSSCGGGRADYLIDLHSGGVEHRFHPLAGFYGPPQPVTPPTRRRGEWVCRCSGNCPKPRACSPAKLGSAGSWQ